MTYDEFMKMQTAGKPEKKGNRHEEDDIQTACVGWFRDHYTDLAPLLFHPNNEAYFGGYKTSKERIAKGARAKAMGVTPGVADLILMYAKIPWHGLCIEMKTRTGRQSDEQKAWQKVVENHGYRYELVRSLDQFQMVVENYTGRPPQDHEEAMLEKIFGKPIKIHKKK